MSDDDFIGPGWATRAFNAAATSLEEPRSLRLGVRGESAILRAQKRQRLHYYQALALTFLGLALIGAGVYIAWGLVPVLFYAGICLLVTAIMQSPRRKR